MPVHLHSVPGTSLLDAEFSGMLHREDYEQLAPAVNRLIEEHGNVAILVEIKDLNGWDAGAPWEDSESDTSHFNDIKRVAFVGDRRWERSMAAFGKPFHSAEVRFFEPHQLEEAKVWLRATMIPGAE